MQWQKKWLKKIFYFTVTAQKKARILNYPSINKAKEDVKVSQTFMKQFLKKCYKDSHLCVKFFSDWLSPYLE